jgi:iron complex transport system substrate-binding protein
LHAPPRFLDENGRAIRLAAPPGRVVSLVPGITETLFAVGAGSLVAGATDYCNHPAGALALPKVGGVRDPRIPDLLALKPDLVFASREENRREDVEAIEAAGVPVCLAGARSVEQALERIRGIAAACGREKEGRGLADRIASRIGPERPRAAPVPVLFPVWEDPLIAPGRGTFVADLLRRAGAVSVAESLGEGWPRCSPDFPAASGAAAVLLPSEPRPYGEDDRRRWLARKEVPACASGRVALVDGELTNRPGPRMAEGIEAVRAILAALSLQAE